MTRTPKFVLYKDTKGEWRWRLVAANGKIVATSGEGYRRKIDCRNALKYLIVEEEEA